MSLVKSALDNGGIIKPLIIKDSRTQGTGLCNPSVLVLNDDQILLNLRNVQYVLYHTETGLNEHPWGPLIYFHPENDRTLRTKNFICELDENLNIIQHEMVDTSELDVEPKWSFIGLEDGRLVYWNNKFYLCGVRRDTTPTGVGRMEFSEVDLENGCKEISRYRIEPPNNVNSYCEKNWMPIIDKPFHFVKWSNPTEVVRVDLNTNSSTQITVKDANVNVSQNMRGSSHVIPYKNGYLGIIHESHLWFTELKRKNSWYTHKFLYWDKNWNLVKWSKDFNIMNGKIEFVCGMSKYKNDYLITFGFQDNAAFILRTPEKVIEEYLND